MTDRGTPADGTPSWPRAAASAAVFRAGTVLLVQRGQGAFAGSWSLPGGHIEPGEAARAAAAREVREETAVEVEIGGLIDIHEVILRRAGGEVGVHYLIAVFWGRWRAGEPAPGPAESAARFVRLEDLHGYSLTGGAAALIRRGWHMLQAAGG